MFSSFRLLPALILAGLAGSSFAGYTLRSTAFGFSPTGAGQTPTQGSPASVSGRFTGFTPDSSADLQISPTDLARYSFQGFGSVVSVLSGGIFRQAGTYTLSYDQSGTGAPNGNVVVGSGNYSLTFGNNAVSGNFIQTVGPQDPSLVDIHGLYSIKGLTVQGTYSFNQIQTTSNVAFIQLGNPVPEPATLGALGLGCLGFLRRRKARSRSI